MLWILGTPGLDWGPLRQWLAPQLPDDLVIEWPDWATVATDELPAAARCLVFVGSPSAALARRISDAETDELDQLLAAWKDAAACCLRLVQARRDQVLLVDATEVQAHPQRLAQCCASLTDQAFGCLGTFPAPAAAEPLPQALAICLTSADIGLRRLQTELEAACSPLNGSERLEPVPLRCSKTTALPAIDAYRAMRTRESSFSQQIEALGQKLSTLERELGDALARPQPSVGPIERETELQSENNMLLLQLHQVQEELEQYYLENKSLRESGRGGAAHTATPGGEPTLGRAVEDGAHRHLNLTLSMPGPDGQAATDLRLRLADHQGVPGLVLFASGSTAPLKNWQPKGEEGGRPYMLIHPAQQGLRPWFEGLGSNDWRRLLDVAASTEAALVARYRTAAGHEAERLGRWLVVARRVGAELAALPAELRHEGVRVEPGPGTDCIELAFAQAHCGMSLWPELRLRWGTTPSAPRLELLITPRPDGVPPLSRWGVDSDGSWLPSHTLRFGGAIDKREARRQWAGLGAPDYAFVVALLRTLARWAADSGGGSGGPTAGELARRMLAEALDARSRLEQPGRRSVSLLGLRISA